MKNSKKGLTLIELLVVILIVGILAAVAIPSYRGYIQRGRRADAKTALEQVRAAQEMWRAEKGGYSTDATLAEIQNTMGAPATSISSYYDWDFTVLNANSFTARAQALGSQATDGDLFINNNGQKWPTDKWAK